MTDTVVPASPALVGGTPVSVPGRWRQLAVVVAPLWADNNESSVLSTLAPVIVAAVGAPAAAVGYLTSVGKFISIVFGPLWAWVARKTNRKIAFAVASGLAGIATAATGLAQSYTQLILLYGLSAVFIAAALPIASEITADLFDDTSRGRANGYTWGVISLLGSVLGPLIGQLSRVPDGWRYGFFIWGAVTTLTAVLLAVFFTDPAVGASETTTSLPTARQQAEDNQITWAKVRQMLRIPTFVLMLIQRLISGHLLIASFGIVFLVHTYGFSTAVASIVTLPFGIGYLLGTFGGSVATDFLQSRLPRIGRVIVLQFAQLGFGVVAVVGTQHNWGGIGVFAGFWAVLGFMQGLNPGVNRPIVAAVVPPEMRGAAFALLLSVFEALAYALFNLVAGLLTDVIGLRGVMLWIPGILMLVNAAFCTILYRTYPRDVERQRALLAERAAVG
ncbi:MFS transporter [Nocardia sp. NPDC051052]|uniref:MFS transporter n=1 Tax=Nocardia sp. NPDC051052 TaxID=3364322 RepID=UPI00378E7970